MAKKVYIGVPSRVKKIYTITNMVGKIGNFEYADMSNSGEGYVYCNNQHYKYGERALLIVGASGAIERTYQLKQIGVGYVKPTLTPSHKYYVRVEVYQETKAGTVDIYWPIAEPSFLSGQSGPAGQWNIISAVTDRASFSAGSYEMRLDYNNNGSTAYMWFDGLILVDLTATFGSGNEPDKAWCDANIAFTTSTTTAKWWDTVLHPVARESKKACVGVSGVARETKKGYVGANGVARKFHDTGLFANFAQNNWADIIWACQNNAVPSTWAVGDKKAMTIGSYSYDIVILGKNHDTYTAGGTAPITFGLDKCYNVKYPMNSTNTNVGGWKSCAMRTSSLPSIKALMPSEVQSAIKAVNKKTSAGSKSTTINTTSDELFLLSVVEVWGSNTNSVAGEGSQYDYYANGGSKIKGQVGYSGNINWWQRSPHAGSANYFCQISASGSAGYYYADQTTIGCSFAFCF